MESLLSPQVWLSLPQTTRAKIAELFGMKKSGGVEIFNGPNGAEVRSDGYSYSDLAAITIERMQELTSSTSDNFYALFKKIVILVNEETLDKAIEAVEEAILDNVEKEMEEVTELEEIKSDRFCQYCTSKGVRHLKICTRNQTENA